MAILPFIIGVAILFLILKILSMPMRIIVKLIVNAIVRNSCYLCAKFIWSSEWYLIGLLQ